VRLRIIITLIGAIVVGTVTAAFAAGSDSAPGRSDRVVAAFYPLAYAAGQLGGAGVHVTDLTPAGAEPHDLELSPDDVAAVDGAGVVLLMGHGFQPQLERAARTSPADAVSLLDAPGVDRVGNDPHVWLDPVRYAAVVRAVAKALGTNPAPLLARLAVLDRAFRAGLADCARRELVTSHAAFAYLARRYSLRQVAVEGLTPDAEPTPRALARVVARVRASKATTVFTEPLVSARIAKTVAAATGAQVAVLDPLEGLTPEERDRGADYFSGMRANLAALREGLGCR
jgi:zinc transport system substrate-binding protein